MILPAVQRVANRTLVQCGLYWGRVSTPKFFASAASTIQFSYLCKRGGAGRLIVPHGQTSSLVSLPPFAEHGCGRAAHRLDRWISSAGSQNSSVRIFWKCRCRLEWLSGHYPGNEIFV